MATLHRHGYSTKTAAAVVSAVADDPSLYFFGVGGRLILFRIDGLVVQISRALFSIFSARRKSTSSRLADAQALHGSRVVAEAIDELRELCDRGLLGTHLPQLLPFGVKTARSGVLIMVTQTCNLACLYCYGGAGTYGQPDKYQEWRHIEAAIEQLIAESNLAEASHVTAPERTLRVTFIGGEPLLRFDIIRRTVEYCEARGRAIGCRFKYALTTNATVVTDEMAAFMKAHRFSLMASLDGTRYYQDKNRPFAGGGGSYESCSNGIRRLVSAGVRVSIRATVVREMVRKADFEEALETARRLGAERLVLSPVDCSHTRNRTFAFRRREATLYGALTAAITDRNIAAGGKGAVFDVHETMIKALAEGKAVGQGRCGACRNTAAVATNGKIYPCQRFVGMEDYAIGSVIEDGIDQDRVRVLCERVTAATAGKCRVCFARLICGGLCWHSMADGRGGFREPDEIRCRSVRDQLKQSAAYLVKLRELQPAGNRAEDGAAQAEPVRQPAV